MTQVLVLLAALSLSNPPVADRAPTIPFGLDRTALEGMIVQHDGRWPPLDTLARDIVESVTGDMWYQGYDPVLVLLAWTFEPDKWRRVPLIRIANDELRRELQLSADHTLFSYAELVRHAHLTKLINGLGRIEEGRTLDPLESKVSDINGKLVTLQSVFRNDVIRPIPDRQDALAVWHPLHEPGADDGYQHEPDSAHAGWAALRTAFLEDDPVAFAAASTNLTNALAALPAAHRPSAKLIATELRYNRLGLFRVAWVLMAFGAALAGAAMLIRQRWCDILAVMALLAGFAVLSYGLWLRWQIAGRIPASNMFESLLFLSWGAGAFAIVSMLVLRHRMVPLTASGMGALALMLADCLPMNHFIRPIAPVLLDTVWMSIHVPVIMVSYSVLALAVLVAHIQLVVMAVVPQRRQLIASIDAMHYWYVHVGAILLLAGIVTGSMWAASSWGRYWGWDPKEVWSLAALLGYLAILHVRIDPNGLPAWGYAVAALLCVALFVVVMRALAPTTIAQLGAFAGTAAAIAFFVLARGPFAMAAKSVLAFWLIIMTYVGVNYVLGTGLHSYGFGTGAMARSMFIIGGADLLFVAMCAMVYLWRRPVTPSDAQPQTMTRPPLPAGT